MTLVTPSRHIFRALSTNILTSAIATDASTNFVSGHQLVATAAPQIRIPCRGMQGFGYAPLAVLRPVNGEVAAADFGSVKLQVACFWGHSEGANSQGVNTGFTAGIVVETNPDEPVPFAAVDVFETAVGGIASGECLPHLSDGEVPDEGETFWTGASGEYNRPMDPLNQNINPTCADIVHVFGVR